jgi:hypothetical protein
MRRSHRRSRSPALLARIEAAVYGLQIADLDVRVDLRGLQRGVAEQLLDVPDVGTSF